MKPKHSDAIVNPPPRTPTGLIVVLVYPARNGAGGHVHLMTSNLSPEDARAILREVATRSPDVPPPQPSRIVKPF